MDSENNIFEKLGGRKFILSILVASAIVAVAVLAPASLTTEVVVGLLGVIAAYSGSNAMLTGLAMRQNKISGTDSAETSAQAPQVEAEPETLMRDNVADLQARMEQAESQIAQLIEIIKQLMPKK
jgi:type IV secretory pathway TrbL component